MKSVGFLNTKDSALEFAVPFQAKAGEWTKALVIFSCSCFPYFLPWTIGSMTVKQN